jgi:hypothetical protein
VKRSKGERHVGARLERIGWVTEDHLKGESHAFSIGGWTSQTLTCGRLSLQPDGLVHKLYRSPHHNDRKRGNGAIIRERRKGADKCSLTTEKMLSANRSLSNIFLQKGQNIEFADKKCDFTFLNFGSWRGLAFY